jgi:hypothetical protein
MPEDRMALAEREVVDAANAISRRLGWGWET